MLYQGKSGTPALKPLARTWIRLLLSLRHSTPNQTEIFEWIFNLKSDREWLIHCFLTTQNFFSLNKHILLQDKHGKLSILCFLGHKNIAASYSLCSIFGADHFALMYWRGAQFFH
jgi:hypothetical protein